METEVLPRIADALTALLHKMQEERLKVRWYYLTAHLMTLPVENARVRA